MTITNLHLKKFYWQELNLFNETEHNLPQKYCLQLLWTSESPLCFYFK